LLQSGFLHFYKSTEILYLIQHNCFSSVTFACEGKVQAFEHQQILLAYYTNERNMKWHELKKQQLCWFICLFFFSKLFDTAAFFFFPTSNANVQNLSYSVQIFGFLEFFFVFFEETFNNIIKEKTTNEVFSFLQACLSVCKCHPTSCFLRYWQLSLVFKTKSVQSLFWSA